MASDIAGTTGDEDWEFAHVAGSLADDRRQGQCVGRGFPRESGRIIRRAHFTTVYQAGFMAITISSAFDAGNIRVVKQDGDLIDLEIVKDHMSDFYQWFYFRLAGAEGREITLRITNCEGAAYPHGWPDYRACLSVDREEWVRVPGTSYADGVLTISLTPASDCVWLAYFAPYSMERHHDLVTAIAGLDGVGYALARQVARRPGHRLPDHRRRRAQGVALCPPASGREHGRMVDGRRAREIVRPRRSGRARASARVHLPRRSQHEPRRVAPRASAHQRGRREPQPRMACADCREEPRGAVRPQRDGRDRRRLRDGHPRRRSHPGQLPCWVRGHSLADRAPDAIVRIVQRHARAAEPGFPDRPGL